MRYIMDRRSSAFAAVLALMLPFVAHCWSTVQANSGNTRAQRNEVSPYIDLVLCPIRDQPWSCARQQSARILDVWDGEVHSQWQKLKAEADRQLNATIEKRGYSGSEVLTKEKPSTILKKIEIGTNYMKEYLAETMDGFLGREYEYMGNGKNGNNEEETDDDDDDEEADEEEDEEEDNDDDDDQTGNENENDHHQQQLQQQHVVQLTDSKNNNLAESETDEFIEIEDDTDKNGQVKRPGGGGGGKRKKKKKKGSSGSQPATLVVVQPLEQHDDHGGHGEEVFSGHGHGGKPQKQKRKKRKKHQQGGDESIVVVEQEASDHLGLGLLEELVGGSDDLLSSGGKRKNKHPSKYGRSNGVTRGKKKKKKKALMKLVLLGTFLKAKIELLLKILGAHLQIKFFAIALIGLLINIARFWIDVKRGGAPQKVVYVEHAHHQHHYEEQGGGDDWNEQGGGSYWKRSLQTDPTVEQGIASTDSYQPARLQQPADAHYMAYRNQWQ